MGRAFSGLAHEVNQPLAAVITIGIAVYGLAVLALKAYELSALKALLKRR